ncbi:ABC transporter permease [Paenibacillus sp. HN-1]|uniref:ABC transporter permease n=1 Tax=Paenibacillus TaxID=44249 RepID=UPI001CA8446D|nr:MULTISPECIES: ABC transporter permease [Paenibacillus]MBY9080310.1 ABC transporter permease [Paenibacillus sp. CGMCC 1.18879]MBY9083031.1 ABC transporter permease [Paenibacillus sinensis]
MKKLLRLFLLDLRLLTKNKTFYLKLILFPSVLILILGTVFSDSNSQIKTFKVALYNSDKGAFDRTHVLSLGKVLRDDVFQQEDLKNSVQLIEAASYKQGLQLLKDGQAAVFVYVPETFTKAAMSNEPAKIVLMGDKDKPLEKEIVGAILGRFNASIRTMNVEQRTIIQTISSKGSIPKDKIEKLMSQLSDNQDLSFNIAEMPTNKAAVPITAMQYYSIAMVVMFSIMTAFVLVHSIVDEKQNHTLLRIKSTPTIGIQYVLGKLAGIISSVVLQMIIVFFISRVVFQIKWGNPVNLLVITVVYAFAIGSIILLWGFTAKDHVTVSSLASPVLYIFSFLGGSFVNRSGLPDGLRIIQEIIPNGKAINAFLKIGQGGSLDGMYIDLLELTGIGLIFIIFSIMVYSGKGWNRSAIYRHGKKPAEADVPK